MLGRHAHRASSRNSSRKHASRTSRLARCCSAVCESLEQRRMLSLTVPAYNSRPGSAQTLYLDFDGIQPFAWNNKTAPFPGYYVVRGPNSSFFAPAPVQAFSTDGDFNNFSTSELANIKDIWSWVSEKYSP